MNRKIILFFMLVFVLLISFNFSNTEDNKEIIKNARKIASEARSLARKGEISRAVDYFLDISEIYKKLIIESPESKGYKKNYEYYLNQTGQVQLKYARDMAKKKKYDIAATYYNSAINSFKAALKKIPKNRVFLQSGI